MPEFHFFFRVYGFEGIPFMLPTLVPDKIAYLEIVRYLSMSNVKHLSGAHKQIFMLGTLHFRVFTIVFTKAYETIEKKLVEEYNLYGHQAWKNYDPEGYIHHCRKTQNLGEYLHIPMEAKDLFRNKERDEADAVLEELKKKLEERKQRLQELKEEGDSESESDENVAVSTLHAPELEEIVERQEQAMVRLNANTDVRMEEHATFVADEVFVQSKEFKFFLYHYKGKRLRESIPNVTLENEAEMLKRLKEDINVEVATMTP